MKRDVKLLQKQGKDLSKLINILDKLANKEKLPDKNKDHNLKGDLKDFRECHIEPDWVLLYQYFEDTLILSAVSTGSHSNTLKI